jgi:hypothetical protein
MITSDNAIFFFQPSEVPLELYKAAVLYRKELTRTAGKSSCDVDQLVLTRLASVCRHWWLALANCSQSSQRRLCKLFHCKLFFLFILVSKIKIVLVVNKSCELSC